MQRPDECTIGAYFSIKGDKVIYAHVSRGLSHAISKRGTVGDFSSRSRTRLRDFLLASRADYFSFGTLTYPAWHCWPAGGMRDCKRHLHALAGRIRRYVAQRASPAKAAHDEPWSFCWFLEFTARQVPHFHFFCTHRIDKDWLAQAWYEVVGTKDLRHLHAGTRIERLRTGRGGAAKYAVKYAAKWEQKTFPDGVKIGRWWGVYGFRDVLEAASFFSDEELSTNHKLNAEESRLFGVIHTLESAGRATAIQSPDIPSHVFVWRVPDFLDRSALVGLVELMSFYSVAARGRRLDHQVLRQAMALQAQGVPAE